ncbi:hypothetical protein FRC09_009217, partial [Ceratobasidium sp. 395]
MARDPTGGAGSDTDETMNDLYVAEILIWLRKRISVVVVGKEVEDSEWEDWEAFVQNQIIAV